jgi:hypothetical protein
MTGLWTDSSEGEDVVFFEVFQWMKGEEAVGFGRLGRWGRYSPRSWKGSRHITSQQRPTPCQHRQRPTPC